MTVGRLVEILKLEIVAGKDGIHRQIKGAFIGDVLSIVMAHALEADIWMTVQSHINTVAVAVLLNLPAIIFTQDIMPTTETIQKANEEVVVLLRTSKGTFEMASAVAHVLEEKKLTL